MGGRLAALALAALAPAAQLPGRAEPSLAELVEGFLAGYRAASELGQRRMCMRMIAEATRRSDPTPDPAVARALGEGLGDASFALRAEVLAWLREEDRATSQALLPPAAERLAREADERAGALRALEEDAPPGRARDDRPPEPLSAEERERVSRARLLGRELEELAAYGAALAAALAEQRDERALDGLLALAATDPRAGVQDAARLALVRFPVRRAAEHAVERLEEVLRALPRAERELEAARAVRKRKRPPRGWEPETWARAEDERVDGAVARAEARLEALVAERETLADALADLAGARGLGAPPPADARPGAWSRWWSEARAGVPETLGADPPGRAPPRWDPDEEDR